MASLKELPPRRKLDWNDLLETALTMPGNVGSVYSRFYSYSWLNQVYLCMQGVKEPVNTYGRWASMGRQVLKGSKAAAIVRPIVIEKKNDTGEVEDKMVRFKPVRCLFTVSQTDGEPLPPAAELPTYSIATAYEELDITEGHFRHPDGNTQGYSEGHTIAINPVAAYPTRTRFHEMAHVVLGHTAEDSAVEYRQHRGIYEFQAESTAYLTMNELELMTPDVAEVSRGYIQTWLRGETPSDGAIRQVFSATDAILKAGRPALGDAG